MSLKSIILRMIAADGPLSVDRYMALCLGHPEHGYYMKGEPLGARGAFTTAPEISQMFGELIGAWCHAAWQAMDAPPKFHWVELGPGRGTLFLDALRAVSVDSTFLTAAQGWMIETSPVLRAQQNRRLKDAGMPLQWRENVSDLPADAPLIVIANEFFDALPIRQAVRRNGRWHERKVGSTKDDLVWGLSPDYLSPELLPVQLREEDEGAIVEFSPARDALMHALAECIRSQGGVLLAIDYGYEGPKTGDTLQALLRHGFADPLAAPGDADITAHVDFFALARASLGLQTTRVTAQGAFLSALGIEVRAAKLKAHASAQQIADIDTALRRLIEPGEMGDLFKVMAICHETMSPLPGFRT